MDNDDIDPTIVILEVEALIDAASHSTDHDRYETLMRWAHETLQPLVDAKMPEALWLNASFTHFGNERLSGEEFDREYFRRIREAADAGNANAQFRLACELDEETSFEESAKLFALAAGQGHVYAKWCHGLNLLSGRDILQDRELGLSNIQEAAVGKFEGAIKFLADAYGSGTHGFPKDEQEAARWLKRLSDRGIVRY
jgi:TPR repeat protein